MLWEVEIFPKGPDAERARVAEEYDLVTHSTSGADAIARTSRGYLLQGDLQRPHLEQLLAELLLDPVAEAGEIHGANEDGELASGGPATVLLKPGVMDPVAMSVLQTARDLGIPLDSAQTFRRYYWTGQLHDRAPIFGQVLCNDAIERIVDCDLDESQLGLGSKYEFQRIVVPIRNLADAGLMAISKDGQFSLSLDEMKTIQAHFRQLERDPTDIELESIAQTWSEHCSHKTLKGIIECDGKRYDNLLKETIFGATQEIRRRLGADDWCVSVFEDNAGVVKFDDDHHVCFKVETHNHPSAIEPYGGANTGIGGVIRDPLGTGLGAKPICNTDVFCFAPPDTSPESLPPGVLHPKKVMKGVVAGVRDYGNRMGIPTINGAICFDPRYLGNPLVYCGTVGLLPADKAFKSAQAGDLIVAIGGRTGRDGIHGATFSSIELTTESEKISGGAVQIGNAITEKKLLDVILQARDQNLYHAITDCGAGGFSSAVGEMGEKIGASVDLEKAPLKYQGLSYTEIWISEAQERMILAVPPELWPRLKSLCAGEDVEATVIGSFEATGKLRLRYHGEQVADLDMRFLHDGRPPVVRFAVMPTSASDASAHAVGVAAKQDFAAILLKTLGHYNVCSKEWIIRQYDHEVQGGSVLKPLVGVANDGPGDASVITPVLGSWRGLAIGCGINPNLGDLDPYQMAAHAIDEAVRNVVAVGADPCRIALLDNFCWGNTTRHEVLGSLVRAAEACHDVALAYMMPFISGKDSLNNEFAIPPSPHPERGDGSEGERRHIIIPPTLLISAMGQVPDVRRCVSMDLKEPGNLLFLVGATTANMGGSLFHQVIGQTGGPVPIVDVKLAPAIFVRLHEATIVGLVRSCHDLSEGGLAVAIAEMAFAGGIGADIAKLGPGADDVNLFAESPTRFLLEVKPQHAEPLRRVLDAVPHMEIGKTVKESRLRIAGSSGEWIIWLSLQQLKDAWQKPLAW
jgi:phosphoribosylformylglycinamidine synthase subunit PurSL